MFALRIQILKPSLLVAALLFGGLFLVPAAASAATYQACYVAGTNTFTVPQYDSMTVVVRGGGGSGGGVNYDNYGGSGVNGQSGGQSRFNSATPLVANGGGGATSYGRNAGGGGSASGGSTNASGVSGSSGGTGQSCYSDGESDYCFDYAYGGNGGRGGNPGGGAGGAGNNQNNNGGQTTGGSVPGGGGGGIGWTTSESSGDDSYTYYHYTSGGGGGGYTTRTWTLGSAGAPTVGQNITVIAGAGGARVGNSKRSGAGARGHVEITWTSNTSSGWPSFSALASPPLVLPPGSVNCNDPAGWWYSHYGGRYTYETAFNENGSAKGSSYYTFGGRYSDDNSGAINRISDGWPAPQGCSSDSSTNQTCFNDPANDTTLGFLSIYERLNPSNGATTFFEAWATGSRHAINSWYTLSGSNKQFFTSTASASAVIAPAGTSLAIEWACQDKQYNWFADNCGLFGGSTCWWAYGEDYWPVTLFSSAQGTSFSTGGALRGSTVITAPATPTEYQLQCVASNGHTGPVGEPLSILVAPSNDDLAPLVSISASSTNITRNTSTNILATFQPRYGDSLTKSALNGPAATPLPEEYYAFTNVGSGQQWTVPEGVTSVEYLVVAGGGGGGGARGGGGGGGGVRTGTLSVTPGQILNVAIGAGGTGGSHSIRGSNGGNSSISGAGLTTVTAVGGGGGGSHEYPSDLPNVRNGNSGGSGGGASMNYINRQSLGGSGTSGQGYAGGHSSGAYNNPRNTGGGGGAGGAGAQGMGTTVRPHGGPGIQSSITGTATYYGGGGGGSRGGTDVSSAGAGTGGAGGGGNGGGDQTATAGTANTGGGGGGTEGVGMSGGSGVVIIRPDVWTLAPGINDSPATSKNFVFNPTGLGLSTGTYRFIPSTKTAYFPDWNDYGEYVDIMVTCPTGSSGDMCDVCDSGYSWNGTICVEDLCNDIEGNQSTIPTGCVDPGTYPGTCLPENYVYSGGQCIPVTPSNVELQATPPRVRTGNSTTITWTGSNFPTTPGACSISTSPAIDGFPQTVTSGANGSLSGVEVGPITARTVVTLTCTSPVGEVTVGTVPVFREI